MSTNFSVSDIVAALAPKRALVDVNDDFTFQTSDCGAEVAMQVDPRDFTVRITIDSQWFCASDLGELVEVLQAAKAHLESL